MSKRKLIINFFGNILVVISFVFIIHQIIAYQINFKELFSTLTLTVLTISIFIYALLVLFYASLFNVIVSFISDSQLLKTNVIFVYCQSNLYKYLPGNIFHYIGRNQIAVNQAVSHRTVIGATVAETLLMILAAIITVLIFAGHDALRWLKSNDLIGKAIFVLTVIFLCFLIAATIIVRVNEKVEGKLTKYKVIAEHIGWANVIKLISAYIFIFMLNSVLFLMLLYSIGGELRINLLSVIGMYTLSWVIGFVTPGAPAGLGIREVIMSSLLTGIVSGELVVTAVILYRMVTIIGDVGGFLIAYLFCH